MSIKRRGATKNNPGDADSNYMYRFTYKGRDFSGGGYRTLAQATDAQRQAMDLAIAQNLRPDDYAGDMTMREAGQWWLETIAPLKRSRFVDVGRMPVIMDYFDKRTLKSIQPSEIDTFLAALPKLRKRPISDHTKNHYRALLHALYEKLKFKKMYQGENPVSFVGKIAVPQARVRFIYPSEEKALTPMIAKEPDLDAYYRLGLGTGMRIGEMRAIRVKHVDLTLKHIFLGDVGSKTKNNRSRYVPLDGSLMGLIANLMAGKDPEDYLLPHWGYTYLKDHFYAICKTLEIKNLHIHDWRHTFAYNLLSQGASIYKVSLLMGHSSIDVTQKHYGHLAAKDLRDALESVTPFLSYIHVATADQILDKKE